jgi:hypothetical protein
MKRAIGIAAATVGLTLIAFVGGASPASAAARPSANNLCGAKNMVNPSALPHMVEAMDLHTAPQGDAGMTRAVTVSSC